MTDDTIAAPPPSRARGDIGMLYRAIWSSWRGAVVRHRLAVVVEVALILAWFMIRTAFDVDGRAYLLWIVVVGVLALAAPLSGLVVFIATSAFFEPDSFARSLPPRELVVLPLAVGVVIQIALDRFRWRPSPALFVAILLLAGTALSLANAFVRFDDAIAWHAARAWLGNAFAPIALLVVAAWTARLGELRALVTATVVGVVVALVCLIEYFVPGSVAAGPFAWVGFWKDFGLRLDGTIPSPNALSAQLIVPTMVVLAAALFARDHRWRLVAIVASIPLITAHYLTFSRSPILGLYAFVVVAAWRTRRAFGMVAIAAGLVVGAVLLPSYLAVRSQVAGNPTVPGTILVASDEYRLRAWGAAARMFVEEPVTGQGYLAYRELADDFGDPLLRSPHNEWLRFFAEGGVVVGLAGIAFGLATTRALNGVPGWLGTGLTAGLLGYALAASFNNPLLFLRVSAVAFPIFGVGLAFAVRASLPGSGEPRLVEGDPELH
ncbi:MAG: O-antigen ligase family protein [Candidatus Limnocylindrales bacterium]